MRRLLKWSLGALLLLILMVSAALAWLLLSTSGARQAYKVAASALEGTVNLGGTVREGSLLRGLSIENLGVGVPGVINITATEATLDWPALTSYLSSGRLEVESLRARGLTVELLDTPPGEGAGEEEGEGEPTEPGWRLGFPLQVELHHLDVADFAYLSPIIDVRVGGLTAALAMLNDHAILEDGVAHDIDVGLKDDGSPSVESPPVNVATRDDGAGQIEPMPTVELPLDIDVGSLRVSRVRYHMEGFDTGLIDAELSAAWRGTDLSVGRFWASHGLGTVEAKGTLGFRDHFHFDFDLGARAADSEEAAGAFLGALDRVALSAHVDGSLVDLGAQVSVTSPYEVELVARANVLSSLLPLTLTLRSPEVGWPYAAPEISARGLDLSTEGSPFGELMTRLSGTFDGQGLSGMAVKLGGRLGLERSDLDGLSLSGEYNGAQVDLSLSGLLEYGQRLGMDIKVEGGVDEAAALAPQLSGPLSLNGDLNATVELDAGGAVANATAATESLSADLTLLGAPTHVELKGAKGDLKDGLQIGHLSLGQGGNHITASGLASLTDSDLHAEIEVASLGTLVPGTTGELRAKVGARGPLMDPALDLSVHSERLTVSEALDVMGLALGGTTKSLTTGVDLNGAVKMVWFRDLKMPMGKCSLSLSGDPGKHQLSTGCGDGPLNFFLSLGGGFEGGDPTAPWAGTLSHLFIKHEAVGNLQLSRDVKVRADAAGDRYEASEILIKGDRLSISLSPLAIAGGNGKARLAINGYRLGQLAPLLPSGLTLSGDADLEASLELAGFVPQGRAKLEVGRGRFGYGDFRLFPEQLTISAGASDEGVSAGLSLKLPRHHGDLNAEARITGPVGEGKLSGKVDLDHLNLGIFSAVGGAFNSLSGEANAHVTLSGTAAAPGMEGEVEIKGSADPRVGVGVVQDFLLKVHGHGQRGELDGKITFNEGKVDLGGSLDWSGGANGRLELKSARLPVLLLNYGLAYLDIDLAASLGEAVEVKGRIGVPEMSVELASMEERGLSPSQDEVLVGEEGILALPPPSDGDLTGLGMDVTLALGEDISIRAMGLNSSAEGQVRVFKAAAEPALSSEGKISLVHGYANMFGRNFLVSKADAIFSGDVANPRLDCEVIADPAYLDEDIEAGVRVTGQAQAPSVGFFSRPSMAQNEIVSYMLYGHGTEEDEGGSAGAQLLMGLGLGSSTGALNSLVGLFGMSNVQIGTTGTGSETKLSMMMHLTPKIRLAYGYGIFTSLSEFRMRYELLRRLYLELVKGLDFRGMLYYSFDVD